jgi:hypothetical protein
MGHQEVSNVSPPPAIRTSQEELLGTTTGIVLTVVVAVVGLAVLIVPVFWAAGHPNTRRQRTRQRPENIPGAAQPGDPCSVTPRRGDNWGGDVAGPAGDGAGGQGHWPSERLEDRHVPEGGNPHGKPSSWVLVAVVAAAFITGGLAIISHTWWLLWACFGVVVLAIPAGKAIGIMDDTVAWGSNPAARPDPFQDLEAGPGQGQPDQAQAPMRDRS